jgi:anti-sigma regulatory factor (Ser/Thr protein kinase)
MDWTLKACDLNKDILTSDKAQLTLPDIQLRLAGRVFRSYVKIMEGKASYRLEESLRLNQILPEALDNIRHPYRSLENKIIRVAEQLSQLNNSVNMILIAMDNRVSFEKPTIANGFENSRWV